MGLKLQALILMVIISGCTAGQICWYYDDYYYAYYQQYCDDGCCGNSESDVCCDNDLETVGIIVGATIGGIIVLSLLISLICCIFFTMKKSQRPGMVIHPTVNSQVTAISSGIHQTVPPPYGSVYPNYQHQGGYQPPPTYSSIAASAPPLSSTFHDRNTHPA